MNNVCSIYIVLLNLAPLLELESLLDNVFCATLGYTQYVSS